MRGERGREGERKKKREGVRETNKGKRERKTDRMREKGSEIGERE